MGGVAPSTDPPAPTPHPLNPPPPQTHLAVGAEVHVGGVEPNEEGRAGLVGLLDERGGLLKHLVVDGLGGVGGLLTSSSMVSVGGVGWGFGAVV